MFNNWVWSKVDVQNYPFGWLRLENRFLKIIKLNNDDKKCEKYSTVN